MLSRPIPTAANHLTTAAIPRQLLTDMVCAKCHKNDATIHFTLVHDGKAGEAVHLCNGCASACGLPNIHPNEPESGLAHGTKCDFCGQSASSRVAYPKLQICCCTACGVQFGRIIIDLCLSERPHLIQRENDGSPSLSLGCNPENFAWVENLLRKTAQVLKQRRKQDGRDKDS